MSFRRRRRLPFADTGQRRAALASHTFGCGELSVDDHLLHTGESFVEGGVQCGHVFKWYAMSHDAIKRMRVSLLSRIKAHGEDVQARVNLALLDPLHDFVPVLVDRGLTITNEPG